MKITELSQLRMANQQLTGTEFNSVSNLVNWMGCVQAQDYAMAKWAIGLRLGRNFTDEKVEEAINTGQILRIHTLRPTWHFVSAEDIRWITNLTAPNVKKLMRTQNRQIGLTDSIFKKSISLIEKLLSAEGPKTREEIVEYLKTKKIKLDNLQATNVMIVAELDTVVCNGPRRGKQFTYTLLDKVVPAQKPVSTEEALNRLAKKYFFSHGPATVKDFMWWSGLSREDATVAIKANGKELDSIKIKTETYWMGASSPAKPMSKNNNSFLLPCYDEFTVGYADRTFLGSDVDMDFFGHFIFRPLLISNGKALGKWSREIKKELVINTMMAESVSDTVKNRILKSANQYRDFLGQSSVKLRWADKAEK